MFARIAVLALAASLLAPLVHADRTQVYSITSPDCAQCGDRVKDALQKVNGVEQVELGARTVEISVRMKDGVGDQVILAAVERAGLKAAVGPDQGSHAPPGRYPEGADVLTLTNGGSRVGPLAKLRVPDKYTVFDVYAEWCGPCRSVDRRLREVLAQRKDVAVRKLNVVAFDSPLARELGPDFDALPYVIVFSPGGKRTLIFGLDLQKLDGALSR